MEEAFSKLALEAEDVNKKDISTTEKMEPEVEKKVEEKSAKGISEEWQHRLEEFFGKFEFDSEDIPDLIEYFQKGELEEIFDFAQEEVLEELKLKISELFEEY